MADSVSYRELRRILTTHGWFGCGQRDIPFDRLEGDARVTRTQASRNRGGCLAGSANFRGRFLSNWFCDKTGTPTSSWTARPAIHIRHSLVMLAILQFLWTSTRGHRLMPWRSPLLRWRIETYTGKKMTDVDFGAFWSFMWHERTELVRFLKWAARMDRISRGKPVRSLN